MMGQMTASAASDVPVSINAQWSTCLSAERTASAITSSRWPRVSIELMMETVIVAPRVLPAALELAVLLCIRICPYRHPQYAVRAEAGSCIFLPQHDRPTARRLTYKA